MIKQETTPQSIDEYIAAFPQEIQEVLESIRQTIRQAAPDAGETISYKIPTFTLHGNLVHFSAYKHHIGFYPGPTGIESFKRNLLEYKSAKGSVQFPLSRPMPYALISKMVAYRVKENLEKAEVKKKR
ncbi:iron chaperone [Catalinimonas niigatensis]|uniref:iron chaperone n=1 Tax=Catalinimonas niigatensis TaxID=1397264 RepID=UPI0026667672|nr:DUF1801 domain-containing protein [Catalinimonas niigatensis]WPP49066.1 DUF1801 domain-containing protein [Catalinimonas niigatensis]